MSMIYKLKLLGAICILAAGASMDGLLRPICFVIGAIQIFTMKGESNEPTK